VVVNIDYSGNILDQEYKLAYYREDIAVNAHHWHWHLVYPATWRENVTGKPKDRKGELFYYMHQQMCARYDCERLSNKMTRVDPLDNWHKELEGYGPHLCSLLNGLHYGMRPSGLKIHDISDIDIYEMNRWVERVLEAISLGYVVDSEGNEVSLNAQNGTDILGDLIEASTESLNQKYYGSIHNWGHVMLAAVHDPVGKYKENPGVMDDTSTSLRDPIFYRWHRFIDNMFQEFKTNLPPYSKHELEFPKVNIGKVTLHATKSNYLQTFEEDHYLELCHGVQFCKEGSVKVHYKRLQHEEFNYNIEVHNDSSSNKNAVVRIFLAPRDNELGNRLELDDQRHLFIELDKFHVVLNPGENTITRKSKDSSVTLSKERTIDELMKGEGLNDDNNEFCSCGWPQHMLIPRSNEEGMVFDLFVMLTNWENDNVNGHSSEEAICTDAVSYCGAKDHKYPDRQAMGFPFDRTITHHTLSDFLTTNMSATEVTIKFKNHH
ncbi:hemocyanin AA6 chain-like, partial [Limulus polyphemus]|uniref:Hemocyanin AA6 chain-like n=1 Tax=Limulus polyphemus TaxID=6850 RepID=A0ABM1B764_LIMPO